MTEQTPQQEASEDAQRPAPESPGRLLKEGRERLQLSTEQVAERLRLRHQIILELEGDLYSKYVANTFTRGYLRAYARLVDVDEERVLSAYSSLGIEEPVDQTMQSFSRRTREQSNDKRLMLVTYIIGAVILGSAVVFWLQSNQANGPEASQPLIEQAEQELVDGQADGVESERANDAAITEATRDPIYIDPSLVGSAASNTASEAVADSSAEQTSPEESAAEQTDPVESQPTSTEQAGSAQADTAQSAPEPSAPEPSEQSRDEEPAQASTSGVEVAEASNVANNAELVLRFSGDTWIRIENNNGDAVAFGVKGAGHTTELDNQGPYSITLGAPENVEMYFQGAAIDLSGYRPGRVVRMTLPPQNDEE